MKKGCLIALGIFVGLPAATIIGMLVIGAIGSVFIDAEWERDREGTLAELRVRLDAGDYETVLKKVESFSYVTDADLAALEVEAMQQSKAAEDALRQQKIARLEEAVAAAKDMASQMETLDALYAVDPDNKTYDALKQRIDALKEKEKQQAERVAKSQEERDARRKKIEAQFSAWDGSHKKLVEDVKAHLNDAGSFEHVQTWYTDMGNHLSLKMRYRARNGFGALMLGEIVAKADLDGNIIEFSEVEP